jgi:hypothetical protein
MTKDTKSGKVTALSKVQQPFIIKVLVCCFLNNDCWFIRLLLFFRVSVLEV